MRRLVVQALVLACSAPAAAQDFSWKEHPEFEWPERVRIELFARVLAETRMSQAAIERGGGDAFDVGRKRIGMKGEIGRRVEFQVERELDDVRPWRDVYLNYRVHRTLELRGGAFKIPFGLEETTGGTKLDFMYRSLASSRLAPGRDTGLMVHGRFLGAVAAYEAGVFAHDGHNARPNGGSRVFGGRTLAGRLTVEPFRGKGGPSDVQAGLAVTRSRLPEGFPALRGRSVLGVSFFDSDLWVRGQRARLGAQLRWRPGPFAVAWEYIRVSDERRAQSLAATDLDPFLARGWYVSGTWVLAGASRASNVDTPRRPLFGGGFGSVQLGARMERLTLGSTGTSALASTSERAESIRGSRDAVITLGATWYPTRWVRVRANIVREDIGDPSRASVPRLRFWSRLVGVQFAI